MGRTASATPERPDAVPADPPDRSGGRRWRGAGMRSTGLLVSLSVLAGAVLLSLGVGSAGISWGTAVDALTAFDGSNEHLIVRSLRLPRTVIGLGVGASLAVAGVAMQAITRNALASPTILGVNAGASFAIVVAVFVLAHLKAAIRDVHAAVPDISFTIEDSVESGDIIWVRVRARGTANGPFFGPPSGRPVDFTVFDTARIVDGRIVEHWGVPDRFAMLVQTGVLARLT